MIDFAQVRARFPLIEVVSRYVELKRNGSEYVGLCPFHADNRPSLTIYSGRDGTQRYRCFACGAGDDVIDFVAAIEGCTPSEAVKRLTGDDLPPVGTFRPPPPPPDQSEEWRVISPVPDDAPEYKPSQTFNPKRGAMKHYKPSRLNTYRDAKGRILFHVARLDFEDGSKSCPMITWCEGPGGKRLWCAKYIEPPYPLLGLDQLARRPKDAVLVVSGEKCYDYAVKHLPSFVPTTWPGGDDQIDSVDVSPLFGRFIVAWPDADSSGARAMLSLYNLVERHGTG